MAGSDKSIEILYPHDQVAHAFAPLSSIPVIAQMGSSSSIRDLRILLYGEDGVNLSGNDSRWNMVEFGGGGYDLQTFRPSAFNSRRFTQSLAGLDAGTYRMQLVAIDDNNRTVATSRLVEFSVLGFEGSLPPSVSMAEPGSLNLLTTTSKIPLSAKGDDSDGAMVGMQFYVDGKPYGGEIPRIIGLAEEAQSYSVQLDLSTPGLLTFPNQGVLSLFAIGHDNSGNYVASAIHNLSYTGGSDLPAISLSSGFLGFSLLADELDLNISTSGEISKIRLKNGNRGSGLFDARIDIIGPGGGAVIEPIIGHDPFGADYGAITGFKVINPGSGYDPNNIRLQVVPIVRGINEGIPARVLQTNPTGR